MKNWGIASDNIKDAKRVVKATEKDKKNVDMALENMNAIAKILSTMPEQLDIEVELGFNTEEERMEIVRGLMIIATVYAKRDKDAVKERICERGAKRVAKILGLEVKCVEVDEE